jgi:hypothetical protein
MEQASMVLRAHLSQYLESEIIMAMNRELMREVVASAPPSKTISAVEGVCTLEIAATMLIKIS